MPLRTELENIFVSLLQKGHAHGVSGGKKVVYFQAGTSLPAAGGGVSEHRFFRRQRPSPSRFATDVMSLARKGGSPAAEVGKLSQHDGGRTGRTASPVYQPPTH